MMSVKTIQTNDDKNINIKLNTTLYNKVKILASILDSKSDDKVQINELMNEAMQLLLNKYQPVIQEELEYILNTNK